MHSKAKQIVFQARRWIGTPFLHQGRMIGVGVDCGGLIVCVAAACGIAIKDVHGYCRQPDGTLKGILESRLIKVAEAEPGDVLLMAPEKLPQHIALMGFDGLIIHASQSRTTRLNKVIEHRYAQHWQNQTIAAYRLPE